MTSFLYVIIAYSLSPYSSCGHFWRRSIEGPFANRAGRSKHFVQQYLLNFLGFVSRGKIIMGENLVNSKNRSESERTALVKKVSSQKIEHMYIT